MIHQNSSSSHSHKGKPNPHKSYRQPTRKRYKAIVIGGTALALCGAASLAHANFGNGELARKTPTASGVKTMSDVTLKKAPESKASSRWSWWPKPTTTTPSPTKPAPTTPKPTTPSTSTPTTPKPTTPSTTAPGGGTNNSKVQFPGHQPGKFLLGMSCDSTCDAKGKAVGPNWTVHRTFKKWGQWDSVGKEISRDHAAGRLPWVSVKPPSNGAAGWKQVMSGSVDSQIKALATVLKANDDKPALITFNHEPSNDASEADGKYWAGAYSHFHDVLKAEGALKNVADPPILQDWLFNPINRKMDPENWALDNVLSRAPFMGIDLYQDSSGKTMGDRIPIIKDYLTKHGYPNMLIGIGETGASDRWGGMSAADWINKSFSWVAANTDKVAMVSYFNTKLNNSHGMYWSLDESAAKMAAYKNWLTNNKVAKLG